MSNLTNKKLHGNIKNRTSLSGNIRGSKFYPVLEDLKIVPSGVEQVFNHPNTYGYNKVTVSAVKSDTLNVIPKEENQKITGLFGVVNVDKIPTKYVIPTVEGEVLKLSRGTVNGGNVSL